MSIKIKNSDVYISHYETGLCVEKDHFTMVQMDKSCSNGRLLYAARVKANMTQNDLSNAIGINRKLLSEYERCKVVVPIKILRFAANVLNLDMSYFKR